MAYSSPMSADANTCRLYALCPLWLWPVLAISLVALRESVRLLEALGCTGVEIRLTPWGRAYVARAHWPDEPPGWKDTLYRTAMGEPVAAPEGCPPALGVWSDDTSADWVRGAGWYARVAAGRGAIPSAVVAVPVPGPLARSGGGIASCRAHPIRPP
ncbi:MAG: hypothetical protein AAFR00_05955 [Pseudomonadota bacterium]